MAVRYVCFIILLCLCFIIITNGRRTARSCKFSYIDGGVDRRARNLIVKEHNNFRKLIRNGKVPGQPKGINLKRMKWDGKLAKEAQIIADTCVYGHVEVKDRRWSVGQNLYQSMNTSKSEGANWKAAMQAWFDEHKQYNYSTEFKPSTGHYTQMVWANTKYVGCGYAFYETKSEMKYEKYYVCNYGPGGNYIGQFPYKTGSKAVRNVRKKKKN